MYVARTKVLNSCVITAKLICSFVFTYGKSRYSHDVFELFYQLWSAVDLSLLGVMRGHKRGVWCVQFSPVDRVSLKELSYM